MTELEKAARMALEALTYLVEHDSYGTEYDGRIIHLCPSCSKQDGEHSQKCDFVKARQVITALTQALATTEPDFDGSVIVGHSKHRGGWFVFEEVAEGEFTPIKGPFSSKDEADQAMRDPRAPLIQPATTERKLVATPDHNGAHVPASPADMQVYNKIAAGYWTERKGEPFGQVTVKHPVGPFHAPLYTFYPWPQPPYLDNVQECHTVYTSPQVPEVLPWKGLDLNSMADAFEQVIEAAAHRENPFVNPVTKQAQLALREFKICIPAMQALDAARKGEKS